MTIRRGYITAAEATTYAGATISEAVVDMAEEMIDAWVKFQHKHVNLTWMGKADSGTTTTIVDATTSALSGYGDDYLVGCEVEIVAGTNKGQIRRITAYDQTAHQITVADAFTNVIDGTSVFAIRQLAKFPREQDVQDFQNKWYVTIPEAVKRAVLAQCKYIIEKGVDFFMGATDYAGESIGGDYSYTIKPGAERDICPEARLLLKNIRNVKGVMIT
jgi:hypothetical protein